MAGKVHLPHPEVVSKWKEEKVIKWLKRVHLDDCISAFNERHIDGLKLLDLTEQKLFTYQDLKIKHRKQIAKCVQECKSQATNAKRIAQTIKVKQRHKSQPEGLNCNGSYISDDYDSDDWGSDFEDESDEEGTTLDNHVTELNNNNIIQSSYLPDQNVSPNANQLKSYQENSIPQPPDFPIITKNLNGTVGRKTHNNSIPRPPIKRPPVQPPPPPVTRVPDQKNDLEDYEIPIGASTPSTRDSSEHSDCSLPSVSSSDFTTETYEIIEPPEEMYEIVDEKPVLPPRIPVSTVSKSPPPPIPQKPKKLTDSFIREQSQGVRTFSRPKPVKPESVSDSSPSSSSPNAGFFSTLMGRRPSNPYTASPKIEHKSKDVKEGSLTKSQSVVSSCDNLSSSRSSSPEKEAFLIVGRSSFLTLGSFSSDIKKTASLSHLPRGSSFDEAAQNMATRPLPPVPSPPKLTNGISDKPLEENLSSFPWFHEIERKAAEDAVRNLGESGSFVVRPSKRAGPENPLSITILHDNRLFHLNIRLRLDKTYALGKEKKIEKTFPTVSELIAFHQRDPIILKSQGEPVGKTILCKYPEKS